MTAATSIAMLARRSQLTGKSPKDGIEADAATAGI